MVYCIVLMAFRGQKNSEMVLLQEQMSDTVLFRLPCFSSTAGYKFYLLTMFKD
jgi:hypothetical protein